MLNLFHRREGRGGSPPEGPASVLASHILIKFLKRLRSIPHVNLLDLGRLSGANIEFFARVGCRVQVEDLLGSGETLAPDPEMPETPASRMGLGESTAGDAPAPGRAAAPGGAEVRTESRDMQDAPRAVVSSVSEIAPFPRRPGARPSRRVVVPPRVFKAGGIRPATSGGPVGQRAEASNVTRPESARSVLPTSFPFPDESFDAIVAWDVYNYYDPDLARVLAAETRRILKPGGVVLAYFHARRLEGMESPGRYRILDDARVACDTLSGRLLRRHIYQNRDIEKMFTGLRIVELYFLKTSMREMLMEKKLPVPESQRPTRPAPAQPKPRFTIE